MKDIIRLPITKQGADLLTKLEDKIHEGFLGGRVRKEDLLEWSIAWVLSKTKPQDYEILHKKFFDPQAFLKNIQRNAKEIQDESSRVSYLKEKMNQMMQILDQREGAQHE